MDKDLKDVCEQLKNFYGSHMAVAKRIGYVHDHYCAMRSDRVPTTRRAEKAILLLAHEAGIGSLPSLSMSRKGFPQQSPGPKS